MVGAFDVRVGRKECDRRQRGVVCTTLSLLATILTTSYQEINDKGENQGKLFFPLFPPPNQMSNLDTNYHHLQKSSLSLTAITNQHMSQRSNSATELMFLKETDSCRRSLAIMASSYIALFGIKISSVVFLAMMPSTSALSNHHVVKYTNHQHSRRHRTKQNTVQGMELAFSTSLAAMVYYPEDEEFFDDIVSSYDIFSTPSTLLSQQAEKLSRDPNNTPIWARLASAFSPNGFAIDIHNINQVRCTSVNNTHLEIEAVVCDQSECSLLLVPVQFPSECPVDNLGFEQCVLRNMDSLNEIGEGLLEQTFADEKEAQEAYSALHSVGSDYLKQDVPSTLPDWWIAPTTSKQMDECELLQQLLNGDDMQDVVKSLAQHVLQTSEPVSESVKVKAIGPAGMMLLYNARELDNVRVLGITIKFATDGERSIREEILSLVASVNVA